MTTDIPRPGAQGGFTLVEVLLAMVILAVGLLALEALGIGAARMVNRAQVQSTWAAVATDTLERTLSRIRNRQALDAGAGNWIVGGDTVVLQIDSTTLGSVKRFDVTVTVRPRVRNLIRSTDAVTVVGSVLR